MTQGKDPKNPAASGEVLAAVAESVEKRTAKRKGRRRFGEIPYPEIERLLVHGELRQAGDRQVLRYPSLRDLGRRFDVDVAQLSRWAKRRNIDLLKSMADAARQGLANPEPPEIEATLAAARDAAREHVVALPGLDPLPPPPPDAPPKPTPVPKPRQVGRPPVSDPPRYSVEELDRLLVFGEPAAMPDGTVSVRYPTQSEVAERLQVSDKTVNTHWRKQHCRRRRAEARARIAARVEDKLVEQTAEMIAVSRERTIQVVDKFLSRFEMALDDGTARTDLPADFERLVRLKEFLLGNAESRSEVQQSLSLELAQRQHAQVLHDMDDASAAELGLIIDTTGVEVLTAPSTEHPLLAPADDDAAGPRQSTPKR